MPKNIALIGLGNMGFPLAENLLSAGYALTVYNRTSEKAQPLVEKGAKIAKTPQEAIAENSVVITLLAEDNALESVALNDAFAKALGQGGIHISMSTISPRTAEKLAAHHASFGVHYLAAPIFGRPMAVAARKAWVCISGHTEAKEIAKPILQAGACQAIYDFGEQATVAHVVKLTGNFMIASAIETMSEAMTLVQKNGVERQAFLDFFSQTIFAAPIYQNYGGMIAKQVYDQQVGFKLPLGLKDLNLVAKTALESQTPMPLANLLQNRLVTAIAKDRSHWDWTGLAQGAADDAGV